MIATTSELITVLRQYNPWWRGAPSADLPDWRRRAFHDVLAWMQSPPAPRALLLSGARQVGKTTLFLQVIQALIDGGVPPNKILYATFDHPLLKLLGLDGLLKLGGNSSRRARGLNTFSSTKSRPSAIGRPG